MPGVPRELVEHTLNMDPKARPVKQPLRRFDEPKRKAIAAELHRLENASFIREIKTSTWVSSLVIVLKKNTNVRRVCVDYTSLDVSQDPLGEGFRSIVNQKISYGCEQESQDLI
jgi:hypothetical protein